MQDDVKIERYRYIGGSDIPIIMGISRFKSRWELLQEKVHEVDVEGVETPYIAYGNIMEEKLRAYHNMLMNLELVEDRVVVEDEEGIIDIRYHSDGYDAKEEVVAEYKTTSEIHDTAREYKYYVVQLLMGMMCHGAEVGYLGVYDRPQNFDVEFDPDRFQLFEIAIEDYADWCDEIASAVQDFRQDIMFLRMNPDSTEEQLPSMTNIMPLANKLFALETQLADFKKLEKQYDEVKEKLCEAMHKNNIKTWTMNNGTKVTYVAGTSDSVVPKLNEKKLKEDDFKLWEKYAEPTIKKGRKGYVKITLPKES